ncbi:uncharacterized protein LOC115574651 isoform X3 [Sparus aurata]|uniref:uncharacterized protein LOC115574651 isoform X3 n=1 Tax=Sparus aurata TaxID=8175 RepID=UPI0011C193CD|nr:uncharacterized protein LOC115574651 isoform X3 [Sparus aurata]
MDTPETQSVLVTALAKGPWRRFYVHLAGDTNGTHKEFASCLMRRLRQAEVSSPEESDYVVVFCPFMSQVETDFSEALEDIPVGKPTILVVMHHTVDRNQVVAESRRLVNNLNLHLTVDLLLRKGKMMNCKQNRTVWLEVQAFLAESYRSYRKKVMTSFTDIMQSGLHIINFSSELTVLLQSIVTHIVVLLSFCLLPGMTSSMG